jgi:hypothetical protein
LPSVSSFMSLDMTDLAPAESNVEAEADILGVFLWCDNMGRYFFSVEDG